MTLVVPDNYPDVENLNTSITGEVFFNALHTKFELRDFTSVSIPKFVIRTTLESMISSLSALGFRSLFSGDEGIDIGTGENLSVDSAVHEALIRVDEEGTEGSAATGLKLVPLSARFATATFIADKPFLYFLTNRKTQTILFAGRVVSPTIR